MAPSVILILRHVRQSVYRGDEEGRLSSHAKPASAKIVGVPCWQEQLAEFGAELWHNRADYFEEAVAAAVLLLAFGVFAAAL
jgi:hypothetical protein